MGRLVVPGRGKLILGVVHLLPLPGSPGYGGSRAEILDRARSDAAALLEGGAGGFIIENYGDRPFWKASAGAAVAAEMTAIACDLRRAVGGEPRLGVNVLRNDAESALAVAAASGCDFIRVNVHTGVMFTDQGMIEGSAAATLRLRRALECDPAIFADIAVKHALPPEGFDLGDAARETALRGCADALIVTGPRTGGPVDLAELDEVRRAVPGLPVLAGSGVTAATVRAHLRKADGVIVGTALKRDGITDNPVDPARVRALVAAAATPD